MWTATRNAETPNRDDLVTERDVARRWGLSTRTLQRWRAMETGPAFIMIGGRPRYRIGDILDYEASRRRGDEA